MPTYLITEKTLDEAEKIRNEAAQKIAEGMQSGSKPLTDEEAYAKNSILLEEHYYGPLKVLEESCIVEE